MFAPFDVEWQGESKMLASTNIFKTIGAIEEQLMNESQSPIGWLLSGACPLSKQAKAYHVLLEAAGHKVKVEDVYERITCGDGGTAHLDMIVDLVALVTNASKKKLKSEMNESTQTPMTPGPPLTPLETRPIGMSV